LMPPASICNHGTIWPFQRPKRLCRCRAANGLRRRLSIRRSAKSSNGREPNRSRRCEPIVALQENPMYSKSVALVVAFVLAAAPARADLSVKEGNGILEFYSGDKLITKYHY